CENSLYPHHFETFLSKKRAKRLPVASQPEAEAGVKQAFCDPHIAKSEQKGANPYKWGPSKPTTTRLKAGRSSD
ncbi:hypothetical protein THAOC_12103, partial [Thalassiosira oceanica]